MYKTNDAIWCNFRLWVHVYEFAASSKVKVQGTTMPIYDIMTLTAMPVRYIGYDNHATN